MIRSDDFSKGRRGSRARTLATLLLGLACAAGAAAQGSQPTNSPLGDSINPNRRVNCTVQDNKTGRILRIDAHQDALYRVLMKQRTCPQNALAFRALLQQEGLTLNPSMVANRGFHNPFPAGSFSFFEAVTGTFDKEKLDFGDFFFGHFTAAATNSAAGSSALVPQQAPTPNNLLLESVVWDPRKQMFNFYEIRGSGEGGTWFYRGDSLDILKDITNVHRNTNPSQLLFGEVALGGARLRCSGCHMNGGPIMKELAAPHDSWWRQERQLPLAGLLIAPELTPIMSNLVDSSRFSGWVQQGNQKLALSQLYWQERGKRTFQEQLRPLFCEQEVNLASDLLPLDGPSPMVAAPAGLFLNECLLSASLKDCLKVPAPQIPVAKQIYEQSLMNFDSLFLDTQAGGARPTDQIDGDHAFESPVKAYGDMLLVNRMIDDGLIDEEFAVDVLAVDMTRPMFSAQRCGLLGLVPNRPLTGWRKQFEKSLETSKRPGAQELLANLRDPKRSAAFHRARARSILEKVQVNATQLSFAVDGYVRLLAERRIAVFNDQISQHPQGQIFEPDFRLIFPTLQLLQKNQQEIAYGGVPGQFWLNPDNGMVELAP
jgi:hypothetical protein